MSTQRLPKLPFHLVMPAQTPIVTAASVNTRISLPPYFTPHRCGRRIYRPNRRASQHLSVQFPITHRYR